MDEIRVEIDALDQQVVTLLGRRLDYVKAASAFKPDAQSIPAPERVAAMLPQRHLWARQAGLDAEFIQEIFRQLIAYFIREQISHYNAKAQDPAPTATADLRPEFSTPRTRPASGRASLDKP